jgi:hypothetical protein
VAGNSCQQGPVSRVEPLRCATWRRKTCLTGAATLLSAAACRTGTTLWFNLQRASARLD